MKMNAVSAAERKPTACSKSPHVSMSEAEIDHMIVDHCG
jgi:hypothetical protein